MIALRVSWQQDGLVLRSHCTLTQSQSQPPRSRTFLTALEIYQATEALLLTLLILMASEQSFPDSLIDEDPKRTLEELTRALEQNSENFELYCQRAYANILLKNYSDAVADAKATLGLKPSCATAYMRLGIAEYHLKNYLSAHEAFSKGQNLDESDSTISVWIKRCEENMGVKCESSEKGVSAPKIKHDWYQTESHVIVTLMMKNATKENVKIKFEDSKLIASVALPSGDDFLLNFSLLHHINPDQSIFKILSSKIEIKMKKTEAVRWETLEGEGAPPNLKYFTPDQYPSSSHYTRNWDKLVGDIKEEEKNEKLEGDAALNKLFQQIYSDGSDEVKRAMNKSFTESGGTVLSTNWKDVGKRKVDVSPPDDAEWKKF
ncbi:protein SGT1 homolog isoform X1 [Polypterus senegalus]|uniref:protein SGT1 homolog isoform X1 n=1 Tax=Polypterus senegalus TaxID=55291 RepID=UPI001964C482|nr:protein SGT1 homolog isoform X1 [Polypterus senegalus]